MAAVSRLPIRPKPTLVPSPNEFAIVPMAARQALADIEALASRLRRGLGGGYSTTASIEAAIFQASELSGAAVALTKALRR